KAGDLPWKVDTVSTVSIRSRRRARNPRGVAFPPCVSMPGRAGSLREGCMRGCHGPREHGGLLDHDIPWLVSPLLIERREGYDSASCRPGLGAAGSALCDRLLVPQAMLPADAAARR